jgi:hypothetical protein
MMGWAVSSPCLLLVSRSQVTILDLLDDLDVSTPLLVKVCLRLRVSTENAFTTMPLETSRQLLLWSAHFL